MRRSACDDRTSIGLNITNKSPRSRPVHRSIVCAPDRHLVTLQSGLGCWEHAFGFGNGLDARPDRAALANESRSNSRTEPSQRWYASVLRVAAAKKCARSKFGLRGANVRFGSKADIAVGPHEIRFTPESGHRNSVAQCPLCAKSGHSALQPKRLIRSPGLTSLP